MARTTESAVQGIIEHDATIDLDPFIEVANALVTDVCTGSSYSSTKLELIERWLSAHFYAIRDPRAESEKAGSVGAKYFGKVGLNLSVTRYGQMAMVLDTAGNLAALSKRMEDGLSTSVGVTWLGTEDETPSEDD